MKTILKEECERKIDKTFKLKIWIPKLDSIFYVNINFKRVFYGKCHRI